MAKMKKLNPKDLKNIQFDSAMVLSTFDPTGAKPVAEEDIVCTTTGDTNVSIVPRLQDLGADINGCPDNLAELVRLTGWDCKVSFTALSATAAVLKEAVGCASASGNQVTGASAVADEMFVDRWIAGEKLGGGLVAIHFKKAMSTAGLNIRFAKNAKGQTAVEMTAHASAADPDPYAAPVEIFATDAAAVV